MVDRSESTRSVVAVWLPPTCCASTTSCQAWPSGERPRSRTLLTLATLARSCRRPVSAATSDGVSGAPARAATTGIGTRLAVPNGAASVAACSLGALAGKNLELLLWVTLDRAGSSEAAAMAPATHTASTSQRKRTQNDPMPRKMASISTCRRIRGPGDGPCAAAGHPDDPASRAPGVERDPVGGAWAGSRWPAPARPGPGGTYGGPVIRPG